jgi:glycosyltransferase involved in cell wall biosynthesis
MNAAESPPALSVIIPVYNGARFLAAAVASVREQDPAPSQIIIVDDGSTDESGAVARSLGPDIEYIRQENAGPAAARNRGLAAARGDFIAFLDVDDLWTPGRTALLVDHLVRNPAAVAVLGRTELLVESPRDRMVYAQATDADENDPLFYVMGAGLYRRAAFERIGLFDPAKRYGEDLDWFVRAREEQLPILMLTQTCLIKRAHDQNMTRGKTMSQMGIASVIRASLLRRRQKDGLAKPLPESPTP